MKKAILRLLSLTMCILCVFTFASCKSKKTESEVDETESGLLIGIDGKQGTAKADDGNTDTGTDGKGSKDTTSNAGGTVVKKPVQMNSKDPFSSIPKRLVGSTVVFATWGDESAAGYMKVIKAFEKKTGINVKIVKYNQDTYVQSTATQIANKAAPDVVIAADYPLSLQILQPLQNIIDLTDDFWDAEIVKLGTVGKNSYTINSWKSPWESVGMVFYNNKIFNDNGLTSPGDYYKANKWSYENYIKCAEDAHKCGFTGTNFNVNYFNDQMGNPTFKYNAETQQFTNNFSNSVAGYNLKMKLVKEGLDKLGNLGTFIYGECSMYSTSIYGTKYNGYFAATPDSDLSIVPLPSSYNGTKLNQAISENPRAYGIAKGSKNPEGAAYFLRYFLDYDYYETAGANIFKNKGLKEMYFKNIVPLYKNNKNRVFNIDDSPLKLAGYSTNNGIESSLSGSSESQVPTLIASKNNIYETSANKINEFINKFKAENK